MSQLVYVISTSYRPGEFKIGKHSGSLEKLVSRYKTPLTNVKIEHIQESTDYTKMEK